MGKHILNRVGATIEEVLNSSIWTDVMVGIISHLIFIFNSKSRRNNLYYYTYFMFNLFLQPDLPSVFNEDDCRGIISAVTRSMSKQSILHVYCDTVIVSDELIKKCYESFDPLMTKKAQEVSLSRRFNICYNLQIFVNF